MSTRIGSCGICGKQNIELEEHHVVEYLDSEKKVPTIYICADCRLHHEQYRSYLKNVCGIDIDRKNQN